MLGIAHSDMFGHRNYKEILQSGFKSRGSTKESRKIDEAKAKYSFCGYNKSISGIEKVGLSTLESTASFSAIKNLIANGVLGINNREIASPPSFNAEDMNKGREILSDAKRFQGHSGLVREMAEFKALMNNENSELESLKSQSIASFELHQAEVEVLSSQLHEKHLHLEEIESTFNASNSSQEATVNSLKYKLEKLPEELKAIVQSESDYNAANIESKKILAGRFSEIESELVGVEVELEELTKGYKLVTAKYEKMEISAKETAQSEIDKLTTEKDSQLEESGKRITFIGEQKDAALDEFHEIKNHESASIQKELADANLSSKLLQAALNNPESEGIERAKAKSHALIQEQEKLEGSYSKAKDDFHARKDENQTNIDESSHLEREHGKVVSDLAASNGRMSVLMAQKEASEDTVFHQIREKSPAMLGTALKVLTRETLLTVSPGLVFRGDDSPLSFDLDCSKLDSQDFYDEDELKRKIDSTGREIERLEKSEAELTGQINTLLGVIAKNKKAIIALEASVNIELKKRQNKEVEVGKVKLTLDVELENERNRLKELILIETGRYDAARSKVQQFSIEKDQQKELLLAKHADKLQDEIDFKIKVSEQYKDNVFDIKERLQKRLQGIQKSLHADLSDKGVQESELQRITDRRQELYGELDAAGKAKVVVNEFMNWSRDVLSRKPSIEQSIHENTDRLKLVTDEFKAVMLKFKAEQKDLQESYNKVKDKLSSSEGELRDFDSLLSSELARFQSSRIFKIEGMPPLAQDIKISYQMHNSRKDKHFLAGKKCYTKLANALRDMVSLNRALRGLLLQEGIRDIDDSSMWYDYVNAFDLIMNNLLQQQIDLVKEQFARIGVAFITKHQELESLHESINKKGREISRMMNEVAPSFDNIISIEAKIESLVNNKNRIPYREKLRRVSLMAEDIQNSAINSEPDDEYYRLVSSLLRDMQMSPQIKEHGELIDITVILVQEGQEGHEGQSRTGVAKTDKELVTISSVGLSYLLLLMIYVAITKTFKNDDSSRVIWPIDELGKLHSENVRALKIILDKEGIEMFAATPESTTNTLCLFNNLYEVDKNRKMKRYIPQKSALENMNDALGESQHAE
jgi:hypothetical protein